MKVILWATLSANGNYARNTPENPPRPEALQDFQKHAQATGNFIVGRATFEGFAAGGPNPSFAGMDIVVVSRKALSIPGVLCASNPREAIELLQRRGHQSALLSGGEMLHNTFLAEGLVTELILNFVPVIEGEGLSIHLPAGIHKVAELQAVSKLGGGVTQMRYSIACG
jgi:dihydrofolate reductase